MKNLVLFAIIISFVWGCSSVKEATVLAVETPEISGDTISDKKQKEFEYLFIEALKQKMIGNREQAVSLLSGCLEIDPNSAAAMYELANMHASNNDITSATLLLEKAVTISPENKWYSMLLARLYQQTKKFNEAAAIYRELAQKEPDNIDYLYFNALMLSDAKKYDEAIKAYENMEIKLGLNEQISVAKQQLFVDAGQIEKAYAECQKLIDSNPDETKYYGLFADLYLSQGDKENALKYYNKILEIDPNNGFVHFSLSNFYLENGDQEAAFKHISAGFLSNEVDIETKLQLYLMVSADSEQSSVTEEKNEKLIQTLIEQYPDDSRVYTVYAEYLLHNQKIKEARAQLLNVLELNQSDYIIWERLLFIDNDMQDWQALYDHSKKAVALFPNQPQVYFLNGVANLQLEKFDETIKITEEGLEYVLENPPLEAQFILLKAEALYKLNNKTEAYLLFDKAISLDPENFIALNNYAYYLSLDGSDLEKAERMSGKVIERFPNNSTYLDTHAWVLFKMQKYKLAKFYMGNAIANGGQKNPTLLEHYGDILFMLQNLEEAKQYWQKAKENGSESSVLDKKITDQKYYDN